MDRAKSACAACRQTIVICASYAVASLGVRQRTHASWPGNQMAFGIEIDEALPGGLARCVAEQVGVARRQLRRRDAGIHEGIHDARRAIRRARAVLALLRPQLQPAQWRHCVGALREAGRQLSPLRDAQSVIEVVEAHAEDDGVQIDGAARVDIVAALRRRRTRIMGRAARALDDADALLSAVPGIAGPAFVDFDAGALAAGMRDGHRRLRRSLRRALARPADEAALHRFRQAARLHWLQLELLQSAGPAVLAPLAAEVKKLSQMLGAERDLHLLAACLRRRRSPAPGSVQRAEVLAAIDARRADLRRRSLRLGAVVCAERSRAFAARVLAMRAALLDASPAAAAAASSTAHGARGAHKRTGRP
jgi:CHAD domain-containing protein